MSDSESAPMAVEPVPQTYRTDPLRLIRRIFTIGGIGILAVFVVVVIVETADIVALASRIHPVVGTVVLYALLVIYIVAAALPFVLYRRFPRALPPPDPNDAEAVAAFRENLALRLSENARVRAAGIDPKAEGGIERALETLNAEANTIIETTAKAVFASTAVSQSGRLDGLVVMIAQVRMVWHLARLYHQRPHPSELLRLYYNVAITSLLAMQIEDLAIEEQLEPLTTPVLSMIAVDRIPVASSVVNIIVKSVIDGGMNAFLTLRVGVICRDYCGATATLNGTEVRRSAAREAASMLGFVPRDIKSLMSAIVRAVTRRPLASLRERGNRFWSGLGFGRKSRGEEPE